MSELDRRDFLKLVGVGAGAAAAAGCSDPIEKLVPYVIQPEEITPGVAVRYASTCRECPVACGLHVTTREARSIKLEGNPDHPLSRGGLCAVGQAALLGLYDSWRFQGPVANGTGSTWSAVDSELESRFADLRGANAPCRAKRRRNGWAILVNRVCFDFRCHCGFRQ